MGTLHLFFFIKKSGLYQRAKRATVQVFARVLDDATAAQKCQRCSVGSENVNKGRNLNETRLGMIMMVMKWSTKMDLIPAI